MYRALVNGVIANFLMRRCMSIKAEARVTRAIRMTTLWTRSEIFVRLYITRMRVRERVGEKVSIRVCESERNRAIKSLKFAKHGHLKMPLCKLKNEKKRNDKERE